MQNTQNVRAAAAKVLTQVLDKGVSLSDALPKAQQQVAEKDGALLQEMCFGVLRHFPLYDAITNELLSKKLKGKQRVFHHLINVGLYQLDKMRIPEHAAVAETVQACAKLKAPGLKGLVNACLRNFTRHNEQLKTKVNNLVVEHNHPSWIIKQIQNEYADYWADILSNNMERAPMWLRVHTSNVSLESFVQALNDANIEFTQPLETKTAILLSRPSPVEKLPGFDKGWFAVQDGAAQHAALLLEAKQGEQVLDACTAPGGKACHILDLTNCDLIATDLDEGRLERVKQNFERLKVSGDIKQGDLADQQFVEAFPKFDRILLDAPCSATGVIRRHPDIKWLRRNDDIQQLAQLQKQILNNLWQKLKPGGVMLYATCSIMPQENKQQMREFLAETSDAELIAIKQNETNADPGWQILPGEHNMDGFYYCRLKKVAKEQ